MGSAGGELGVDEYGFIVHRVGVLRNLGQLDVVVLPPDLRVHQHVQLVVGALVVPSVRGLVQMLLPVRRTVLGSVYDVVFYCWRTQLNIEYAREEAPATIEGLSGYCSRNCCCRSYSISWRKVCL